MKTSILTGKEIYEVIVKALEEKSELMDAVDTIAHEISGNCTAYKILEKAYNNKKIEVQNLLDKQYSVLAVKQHDRGRVITGKENYEAIKKVHKEQADLIEAVEVVAIEVSRDCKAYKILKEALNEKKVEVKELLEQGYVKVIKIQTRKQV